METFVSKVENVSIDIFICSASFEERCFVVPKLLSGLNIIRKGYVFYNCNEVTEIISNSEDLKQQLKFESELISLNSNDPVENYIRLMTVINEITHKYDSPNVLIDTTTFTHETLLVLIKLIENKKDLIGDVFISYLGAKEYSIANEKDEDKWLSKGVDDIRTIIGYPGFTDPTKKNHLIILFGFEYDRTVKIIEVYEYDSITLGFGDRPIQNNHMKINCERHKKLLSEYSEARELKFSLVDPLETKNQLLKYIEDEGLSDSNIVIAPMNNKISTIGAGLAAMTNENIQLAYAKASLYNINGYSSPGDTVYFFEINFDKK